MITHLSAEEIRSYLARRMVREGFVRADNHVHQCRSCYRRFLAELETRLPIEIDLDELAGLRDWHPGSEELAAYLEGPMDELDYDCVSLHLQECGLCRERLENAAEYRLDYSPTANAGTLPPAGFRRDLPAFHLVPPNRLRIAGVAAVVILLALAVWAALHTTLDRGQVAETPPPKSVPSKEPVPEDSNPKPRAEEPSAPSIPPKVAADRSPDKRELGRRPDELNALLIAKTLTMPSSIERLDRTPAVVTRGSRASIESFSVISPFVTLVGTDRPTFRWTV